MDCELTGFDASPDFGRRVDDYFSRGDQGSLECSKISTSCPFSVPIRVPSSSMTKQWPSSTVMSPSKRAFEVEAPLSRKVPLRVEPLPKKEKIHILDVDRPFHGDSLSVHRAVGALVDEVAMDEKMTMWKRALMPSATGENEASTGRNLAVEKNSPSLNLYCILVFSFFCGQRCSVTCFKDDEDEAGGAPIGEFVDDVEADTALSALCSGRTILDGYYPRTGGISASGGRGKMDSGSGTIGLPAGMRADSYLELPAQGFGEASFCRIRHCCVRAIRPGVVPGRCSPT